MVDSDVRGQVLDRNLQPPLEDGPFVTFIVVLETASSSHSGISNESSPPSSPFILYRVLSPVVFFLHIQITYFNISASLQSDVGAGISMGWTTGVCFSKAAEIFFLLRDVKIGSGVHPSF